MNRIEFEALRSLKGKIISEDIIFTRQDPAKSVYTFKDVIVSNNMGLIILLNGHYDPRIPKCGFNFTLEGTGPICRLDVNGTVHKKAGRNHKHELVREMDSLAGVNLPTAVRRDDFHGLSLKDVWDKLCSEACITHTGGFHVP